MQRAEESKNTTAAAADTPLKALVRSGIHLCMADVLSRTFDPDWSDYETTNEVRQYLIAWAMLLAHIIEMPTADPGKSFLAQVLRASNE